MRAMNESSKPFYRCPLCSYKLQGLPAEHKCPECGLDYDPTTRVWFFRREPSVLSAILSVIGVTAGMAVVIDAVRHSDMRIMGAAMLVMCVWGIAYLYKKRPIAILSRKSLTIRGRFSNRLKRFQLDDLDLVSSEPLVVKSSSGKGTDAAAHVISIPCNWMTVKQAADFTRAFLERWRACRDEFNSATASASETSPP